MKNESPQIIRTEQDPLTKEQAQALHDKFKQCLAEGAVYLYQLYTREGWRALGYGSWIEYRNAEFASYEKSQIYRLLKTSKVSETVGVPVQESHAQILDQVPGQLQLEAYARAGQIAEGAGASKVTAEHVREAVEEVKQHVPAEDLNGSRSEPRRVNGRVVGTSVPETPDQIADRHEKRRDKWDRAVAVIREVCGGKVAKAIEQGTLNHLNDDDIVLWAMHGGAARDRETLHQIERLVSGGQRYTVRQALGILSEVPSDKSRLAHMHNLAIAEGGATLSTVGGATHVTLAAEVPKALHQQLEALVKRVQSR